MKEKKTNEPWMPDVNTKTREKRYSIPMKDLHSEHWYGETGIELGQRCPSKQEPQLTQQHKPMWLVECNCPTYRS